MIKEVHLKGGYSDRKGITNFQSAVQFCSLNERTRNKLFLVVYKYLFDASTGIDYETINYIYYELFGEGKAPSDIDIVYDDIKKLFLKSDFIMVFTLLEGMAGYLNFHSFTLKINKIFEDELVQHRFIGNQITDLTDEHEIESVQSCIDNDVISRNHIEKATQLLCDREHPDYENSVKEAISAVEAKCCDIIGEQTTLGDALKKIEASGRIIHPAMKEAFNKLFGYTSDANGIRHGSGMDVHTKKPEAKFMLVSCAAFCNYLREYQE